MILIPRPPTRSSGCTTPTWTASGGSGTTAHRATYQNPPLVGMDAVMDPWSYTEPDTRDVAALGYTYA